MKALVAIPAYNEAATIGDVLADVRKHCPDLDILVVDDGSIDGTAHGLDQAAIVLQLPFNLGVGAAMRTAFLYAHRHGYDALVQVDADGQHDPADIEILLRQLGSVSVVVGARGDSYTVTGPRRTAMRLLAWSLTRIVGTPLTDVTSGFRASDRRAIELYARGYPSEYLGDTVESLVMAKRAGLPIVEVDVGMRPRQGGEASQGSLMAAAYLIRALLALMMALTRPSGEAT